jgi:hypothetical protein
VCAFQGGVVPGEDLFEGAAFFVGAFDGRVVEADEHVLRGGTHVDDLLFGSGECGEFVLLWVLAKRVDVLDSALACWLCDDTSGWFGRWV